MAFVAPVSVPSAARPAPALRVSALTPSRPAAAASSAAAASAARAPPRMGYGDYSYLTDKTKGHVNQYYVEKFRVAADFVKGGPATAADAKLGRNLRGGVAVPPQGVPQELDPALPPRDPAAPPDPRLAESTGELYAWDPEYEDPRFGADTYADVDDPATADAAFAAFRSSVTADRGTALSALDFGAVARVQRILGGLDEKYLCSLDGQLDAAYARLQKLDDPAVLSPTGVPQTEIPGTPYLRSVGALDFQKKPQAQIDFWSDDSALPPERIVKRPSGADTPELPYNVSATIDALKEAQEARGLLPSDE